MKTVPYTVCTPVSETPLQDLPLHTVCRQEQKTCYKKVPYTVSVPVTCTVMQGAAVHHDGAC